MAAQDFSVTKKKIGRPPGRTRPDTVPVRVAREVIEAVEVWISEQPDPRPSRPEAIRQLIKIGIDASIPRNPK